MRMTTSTYSPQFVPGLGGVVAAQTRLSSVNGLEGELIIAGFPLQVMAGKAPLKELAFLLWHDALPTAVELNEFRKALIAERNLPTATLELLKAAAQAQLPAMDALLLAASSLNLDLRRRDEQQRAVAALARFPVIVAT